MLGCSSGTFCTNEIRQSHLFFIFIFMIYKLNFCLDVDVSFEVKSNESCKDITLKPTEDM